MVKNKKGIELSVNFMVVVILSVVMLSLGLILIKQFFSKADDIKGTIEDATEKDMEDILTQDDTVAVPINRRVIERGKSDFFNLYVLNILGNTQTFDVTISFNKAYDEFNQEITVNEDETHPDAWLYYVDSFQLENNQAKKLKILVNVPKEVEIGEYIFNVNVGPDYGVKKMYVFAG